LLNKSLAIPFYFKTRLTFERNLALKMKSKVFKTKLSQSSLVLKATLLVEGKTFDFSEEGW